jgi:pimeloyl-ACP methyl ester carboxylesterase
LFYEDQAALDHSANQPTIVFSDGLGCDGFAWKHLRNVLSDYRLIHWHYPGHGRTPRRHDSKRYAMEDLAADLFAVLDDASVDKAVLFGHSMGVQVSLEAYRRAPERVLGLGFVCGMAENPLKTFRGSNMLEVILPALRYCVDKAPRVLARLSRAVVPTKLAYAIASQLEINAELLQAQDFAPYLRGLSRVDPDLFVTILEQAGKHSAADLLATIAVPTLVVAGDQDGFTPPELSRHLADQIPGAELLLVEGGTHTTPIERPELVNEVVLGFLRQRIVR